MTATTAEPDRIRRKPDMATAYRVGAFVVGLPFVLVGLRV